MAVFDRDENNFQIFCQRVDLSGEVIYLLKLLVLFLTNCSVWISILDADNLEMISSNTVDFSERKIKLFQNQNSKTVSFQNI